MREGGSGGMKQEHDQLMRVTVLLENRDGDRVCLNCKHLFAVIQAEDSFPGADTNYCPHCGARVLSVIEVGCFEDLSAASAGAGPSW